MSRYMNDYDIQHAVGRFIRASKPNRLALAYVVQNLAEWADEHSDGWAYWQAPRNAADKAMRHIESTTNAANDAQETEDISDAQVREAVRPIKAFLTRQKAEPRHKEIILRSTVDAYDRG